MTQEDRASIIDEYGELSEKVAAWKPTLCPYLQRFTELKLKILSWYELEPADQRFVAAGTRYKVAVKPRRRTRTVINVEKLVKLFGLAKIAKLWEPTLGLIEKEVPAADHDKYIKEERTGPRELDSPVRVIAEAP